MSHLRDWNDRELENDMFQAIRLYNTTGPRPSLTRGIRGILIGAVGTDGLIMPSFDIYISGKALSY